GNTASANAPAVAALTGGLLRTGTANRSEHAIDEELRRIGADLGTGAGAGASWGGGSGASGVFAGIAGLGGGPGRNPAFPVDAFERERRNTIEGVRLDRSSPSFLAGEKFRSVLFGSHPYAIVSPTEEQVAATTREQLAAFHQAHYSPANALLLAVGD